MFGHQLDYGVERLLDSKVWYNRADFMWLFARLLELERLTAALKSAKLSGERVRLNGEIKGILVGLNYGR